MSADIEQFRSTVDGSLSITVVDAVKTLDGLANNKPYDTNVATTLTRLINLEESFRYWLRKKLLEQKLEDSVDTLNLLVEKSGKKFDRDDDLKEEIHSNPPSSVEQQFSDIAGQSEKNPTPKIKWKNLDLRLLEGWSYDEGRDSYHLGSTSTPAVISFSHSKTAKVDKSFLPDDENMLNQLAIALIDKGFNPIDIYEQPSLSAEENTRLSSQLTKALKEHGYEGEIFTGVKLNKQVKNEKKSPQKSKETEKQKPHEQKSDAEKSDIREAKSPSKAILEIIDEISEIAVRNDRPNEEPTLDLINERLRGIVGQDYSLKLNHSEKGAKSYTATLQHYNRENKSLGKEIVVKESLSVEAHEALNDILSQTPQHATYLATNLVTILSQAEHAGIDLKDFGKVKDNTIEINTFKLRKALKCKGMPPNIKKIKIDLDSVCNSGLPLIHAEVKFSDKSTGTTRQVPVTISAQSLPFEQAGIGNMLIKASKQMNSNDFVNKLKKANDAAKSKEASATQQYGDIHEVEDTQEPQWHQYDQSSINVDDDMNSSTPPSYFTDEPMHDYSDMPQYDTDEREQSFTYDDWARSEHQHDENKPEPKQPRSPSPRP
ncbi:hypothetical protein [Vibrio sp. D431a]|uniref:hypothetical protein n=1 Tax=Vibrio sp. D431a TaxID=2837388 RepID=UPI002556EC33|nr:hypothetical protein [Vibrio sp. D431a]MDK9790714.1 hypothetical protein [Vibrio sp. D431a]